MVFGDYMLYYTPPPLTLAPHTPVAPRAGFDLVYCATSCYWQCHMPRGDVVWPMVNSGWERVGCLFLMPRIGS
jgi:hypothetical protein